VVSWAAPFNIIGIDPQLIDPENGDYRVTPGSPAEEYGCQIFPDHKNSNLFFEHEVDNTIEMRNKLSSIQFSGTIDEDTIWQADTVQVVGDIEINNNVVLTIFPSTRVEFQGYYFIEVNGSIKALGESDGRILFTSAYPELFEPDSTTSGAWNGIRFHHTSSLNKRSVFSYCDFSYSKTFGDSIKGGAISFYDFSKGSIENSSFTLNVADYGGALGFDYHSSPEVIGCIFTKNYALKGGSPIYCAYSYPCLINNTVIDNNVLNEDINYRTAAVQTFISKSNIINNIIRDNFTNYFDPGQLVECKDFYTKYNNIEYGHGGTGNINEDPFFSYYGEYPYSLLQFSPCIDAGIPDTTDLSLPMFDFAGNDRLFGNRIDMGALEWQGYAIDDEPDLQEKLLTCFPNPFSTSTTLSFSLITNAHEISRINIYNIKGQLIKTISSSLSASWRMGTHEAFWDGKNGQGKKVEAGIYFITWKSSGIFDVTKIVKID